MLDDLTGWQWFCYSYWTISIVGNVLFTVVITFGGMYDLKYLFSQLNQKPQVGCDVSHQKNNAAKAATKRQS